MGRVSAWLKMLWMTSMEMLVTRYDWRTTVCIQAVVQGHHFSNGRMGIPLFCTLPPRPPSNLLYKSKARKRVSP